MVLSSSGSIFQAVNRTDLLFLMFFGKREITKVKRLLIVRLDAIGDFTLWLYASSCFRELYPDKKQYSYFTYRWPGRHYNKGLLIDFALVTKKILKKYFQRSFSKKIVSL